MPRIPIERQPLSLDVSSPVGESRAGLQLGASIAGLGESISDAAATVQADLHRTMNTIEVEKAKSDFSIRAVEKQSELERQFDAEYQQYNSAPAGDTKAAAWKKEKVGLTTRRYKEWLDKTRPEYEASFGTETARLAFIGSYEGMARDNLEKVHAKDLERNIKNELIDSRNQAQRISNTITSYSQVYDPDVPVNSIHGNEWYQQVTSLSSKLASYTPLWGRERVEEEARTTKALWSDSAVSGKITEAMRGGKKSGTRVAELKKVLDILDEKDSASAWAMRTGRIPLGRLMDPNTKETRRRQIISMLDVAEVKDSYDLTGRLTDMRAYLSETGDVNAEGITSLVGMVMTDKNTKDQYEKARKLGNMWGGLVEYHGTKMLAAAPDTNLDALAEKLAGSILTPKTQAYLSKSDPNWSTVGQAHVKEVKEMLVRIKDKMQAERSEDPAGAMTKNISGMGELAVTAELERPDKYAKNAAYIGKYLDAVDQQYATYKAPRRIETVENGKRVTKMVTSSAYASGTGAKEYIRKNLVQGLIQKYNNADTDVANSMASDAKLAFGHRVTNFFNQLAEAPGSNKLWKSVGAFPADGNIQRLVVKAIQHQRGLVQLAPNAFEKAKVAVDSNPTFGSYISSAITSGTQNDLDLANNMKTLIALRAVEMAGGDNKAGNLDSAISDIATHVDHATREIFDQSFVTFTNGELYGTHFPKKVMDRYSGSVDVTENGLQSFIDGNLKTKQGLAALNITYPSIKQDGKVRPMNEFDKVSFANQVASSARLIHGYKVDKAGNVTHGVMVAYRKRLNDGTQIASHEYLADKEGQRLFIPLDVVMKGAAEIHSYMSFEDTVSLRRNQNER